MSSQHCFKKKKNGSHLNGCNFILLLIYVFGKFQSFYVDKLAIYIFKVLIIISKTLPHSRLYKDSFLLHFLVVVQWLYLSLLQFRGLGVSQAPLSMGFTRQECRSGLPSCFPGALPYPGINTASPALASRVSTTESAGNGINHVK